MSQKVIMLGAVEGSVPLVAITGSLTVNTSFTVEVTTAGVSGVAKVTVIRDDTKAEVLAATAVTSGTPIAMAAGCGSITLTWTTGALSSEDIWIYAVAGGIASKPEAYARNRTGIIVPILVDENGAVIDSSKFGSVPEVLVTAQNLTSGYVSFGIVDCTSIDVVGILVDADVNLSTNVDLKVMGIFTAAGTPFEVDAFTAKTLWTATTPDFKKYYQFATGNLLFVDIQAMAGVVGGTPGDLTLTVVKA